MERQAHLGRAEALLRGAVRVLSFSVWASFISFRSSPPLGPPFLCSPAGILLHPTGGLAMWWQGTRVSLYTVLPEGTAHAACFRLRVAGAEHSSHSVSLFCLLPRLLKRAQHNVIHGLTSKSFKRVATHSCSTSLEKGGQKAQGYHLSDKSGRHKRVSGSQHMFYHQSECPGPP